MTKEVLCIIYPFSVRTANIQALKYFMILFNCNKKYCTVSWLLLQNKPRQGDRILYHPEGTYFMIMITSLCIISHISTYSINRQWVEIILSYENKEGAEWYNCETSSLGDWLLGKKSNIKFRGYYT